MVVCDKCGGENPQHSRFCNSCGSRLEPKEVHPSPRREKDETPCPRCGKPAPPYVSFCPHCAFSLKPEPQVDRQPERGRCPECGRLMAPGATTCTACIWEHTATQDDFAFASRDDSNVPVIVGILLLGASISSMISAIMLALSFQSVETFASLDLSGFLTCCGAIFVAASIICFAGAILSFKRIRASYVVLAAAIGILGVGPFCIASILSLVALILAALSMDEYD